MENTVVITIRAEQSNGIQTDTLETIQSGLYRHISDKDIVSYEEMVLDEAEGSTAGTRNILKIQSDFVTLSKKGAVQTEMEFVSGQSFHGFYQTPYGVFDMVIQTKKLIVNKDESQVHVFLHYDLELNGEFISECKLNITIRSAKG